MSRSSAYTSPRSRLWACCSSCSSVLRGLRDGSRRRAGTGRRLDLRCALGSLRRRNHRLRGDSRGRLPRPRRRRRILDGGTGNRCTRLRSGDSRGLHPPTAHATPRWIPAMALDAAPVHRRSRGRARRGYHRPGPLSARGACGRPDLPTDHSGTDQVHRATDRTPGAGPDRRRRYHPQRGQRYPQVPQQPPGDLHLGLHPADNGAWRRLPGTDPRGLPGRSGPAGSDPGLRPSR
jgi:hypothetical protein